MSRSNRWSRHRVSLLIQQGGKCAHCGTDDAFSRLTVDHIVPRSRGGSNSWENLQLLCEPCNQAKADKVPARVAA